MNYLKKYWKLLLIMIFSVSKFSNIYAWFSKESIAPNNKTITSSWSFGWDVFENVFEFIRDSFFALIFIVALWEFKKASMSFIYTAVWLFVVAFSWAIIKIASSINF